METLLRVSMESEHATLKEERVAAAPSAARNNSKEEEAVRQPPTTSSSQPAAVHALNILRALYRDSRLGEHVVPFIPQGVVIAIEGFFASLWPVSEGREGGEGVKERGKK